ncbi:DUF58 domain-containing protein [Pacificimonas sp. WHA3]|uniref:DUF58 domain-containing protein n=1 Tax=Pacificimonas pallii TaxID=2827236 RepID=A0ABS6SDF1_9SPHN|nr:DUF58 domain-containing protein [Pacificimonas pallii]MBV7256445.1 DUF58 domain-containing protein [Pacificimonas pallii]
MIYPTPLAILLAALGIPAALMTAAISPAFWWVGMAWAGAVLIGGLVDALMLRDWPKLELAAPALVPVGEPFPVSVTATFASARKRTLEWALGAGPRIELAGDARRTSDTGTAAWTARASRRGPAIIGPAWARWRGPLGLAWRQRRLEHKERVGVTQNIAPLYRPPVQAMMRDAAVGMVARMHQGEGTEFQSLVEFRTGMDRRSIDWKRSASRRELVAREYRTERNNQIVFALDCGRAMVEPIKGVTRLDRAVTSALTGAYVALKSGDRAAIYAFASQPKTVSAFASGTGQFPRLQSAASEIDYSHEETNYTLGLTQLGARLQRRSLIVVFTEFADPTSAELLVEAAQRLLERHLVIFILQRDEELEAATEIRPETPEDVSRAVTAAALLKERQLVITRLRHLGSHIVESRHGETPERLIDAYFAIKRRGLL